MSSQPYPSAVPASVAVAAGTTAADALATPGSRSPARRRGRRPRPRHRRAEGPRLGAGPGRAGRAGRDGLAPTAWPSCATPPRTSWPRPCRSCSRAPGSASARRSRTASTTTSTSRQPVHPGGPRAAIEKRMQEIVKAGQRFSRRVGHRRRGARAELADEPYKLELIGLKGAAADRRGRRRRGRRRRADHLRQPRRQDRRAVLEGPVPRPAPAHHPAASRRSS